MNRELPPTNEKYDLIVVAGGVYGVALTLEASRRGLKTLLLERHDFGQHSSANSLRIIHGGLRYLQAVDLHRHLVSVRERRRFLRDFPDLVSPLSCLMPLYNEGARRRSVLRIALAMNDVLSFRRNEGVADEARLPMGRILRRDETIRMFPHVDQRGLRGAALWYDGIMRNWQRVLCEMLRWARSLGATTINYVEAIELLRDGSRVTGLVARDSETNETIRFHADVVVNSAGPWCSQLALQLDNHLESKTLHYPSLAFNIQFDCQPPSEAALAVAPRRPGARTYFVVPWQDSTLVGTYHSPCTQVAREPKPSDDDIDSFLTDLNEAIPNLSVSRENILRVFCGLLPAKSPSSVSLVARETIVDHSRHGGPDGLLSVLGVKFTTARHVAERTLQAARRFWGVKLSIQPNSGRPPASTLFNFDTPGELGGSAKDLDQRLRQFVLEESAVHLDDIMFRRTDWGGRPSDCDWVADQISRLLQWDLSRCESERLRLNTSLQSDRSYA